jgi:hypothetical protein
MPRKARNRKLREEFKISEDPFLLDDPGGSPLDWLERSLPSLHEAIRHASLGDPWERAQPAPEEDELTEHRRRKLGNLSLDIDSGRGESVA